MHELSKSDLIRLTDRLEEARRSCERVVAEFDSLIDQLLDEIEQVPE